MSHVFTTTITPQRFAGFVLACCIFLLPNIVQAGTTDSATLQWEANQESDLKGYRVYHGTASGIYGGPVEVGKLTTYQLANLESNKTHYFTVTAYDTAGNESAPSVEVFKPIPGQNSSNSQKNVTGLPQVFSPSPSSPLATSSVTFQWSAGSGMEYYLGAGTSPAAVANAPWGNIFAKRTGTTTSQVVSDIPLTGKPVYVRLWYRIAGTGNPWFFTDYTYQTQVVGSTPALFSPSPSSPLATSSVTFQWSAGSGMEYYLGAGTSPAAVANAPWGNIFAKRTGTTTSQGVSDIPLTGQPVYVRLWYRIAGTGNPWFFTDYTYQTQTDG